MKCLGWQPLKGRRKERARVGGIIARQPPPPLFPPPSPPPPPSLPPPLSPPSPPPPLPPQPIIFPGAFAFTYAEMEVVVEGARKGDGKSVSESLR